MKMFFYNYMEHSKKYILLNIVLGVMELLNFPLKFLYLIVPVVVYVIGTRAKKYLELPYIPDAMQHVYDSTINILLLVMFVSILLAIITNIGKRLRDKENQVLVEALKGEKENGGAVQLVYKRRHGAKIIRKIYSHTIPSVWNKKNVSAKILTMFNEHFDRTKFFIKPNNSRITILKTEMGIVADKKIVYRDEALDKEMDEI